MDGKTKAQIFRILKSLYEAGIASGQNKSRLTGDPVDYAFRKIKETVAPTKELKHFKKEGG